MKKTLARIRAAFPQYRKAVVSVVSALGIIASTGLLTGQAEKWVNIVLAVAFAIGVYGVPNKEKPAAQPAPATAPVAPIPPATPPAA